jgi:hypothetical protein
MLKITTQWFWSYIVIWEPFNETTLLLLDNRLALISNHNSPYAVLFISLVWFVHTLHVQKLQGIVHIRKAVWFLVDWGFTPLK